MSIAFGAKIEASVFNDAFVCVDQDNVVNGNYQALAIRYGKTSVPAAATLNISLTSGVTEITGTGASDIASLTGFSAGAPFIIVNNSDSQVTFSAFAPKVVELDPGCAINLTYCDPNYGIGPIATVSTPGVLGDLSDVDNTTNALAVNDLLIYNGFVWANSPVDTSDRVRFKGIKSANTNYTVTTLIQNVRFDTAVYNVGGVSFTANQIVLPKLGVTYKIKSHVLLNNPNGGQRHSLRIRHQDPFGNVEVFCAIQALQSAGESGVKVEGLLQLPSTGPGGHRVEVNYQSITSNGTYQILASNIGSYIDIEEV